MGVDEHTTYDVSFTVLYVRTYAMLLLLHPLLTISHALGGNEVNLRYSLFVVVAVAIAVACIVTREPPTYWMMHVPPTVATHNLLIVLLLFVAVAVVAGEGGTDVD
mmetsp:Transcript_48461/g.54927  ORF Transcript_48461/g.54927 Transcript_48461/m.54927 type:complete len:106 (+) Transcript_48461:181-498(+)